MVKRSPFPHVKGEIGGLVDNLFGLPYSSVWIHEMQLFYLIKVRARKNYGKRDVLSLMLDGIRKGYCGNKQIMISLHFHTSPQTCLNSKISTTLLLYKFYGRAEPFLRGRDTSKIPLIKPRWRRTSVLAANWRIYKNDGCNRQ